MKDNNFTINTTQFEKYAVIELEGVINIANSNELSQQFINDSTTSELVVLDLAKLQYIDSSGIMAILQLKRILMDRATPLLLFITSSHIRKLMQITRLDTQIPVYEDRAKMLADIAADKDFMN